AEVHALLPGVVERVLAGENQMVTSGQVIAELGTWQQDHDIAATTAALERQQAELALLQHGAKAEAISAAREQRDMAQVRAGHSRKLQELLAPVHKTGVVKDLEYQEAVKTADVDQAAVAVAAANLDLIKSPPLPMEVAVQQAALKQLREQLTYLRDQRERTRLRAPIAGTVATPRLEFKTGTFLKEGDLLAVVEDSSVMQAEILAPESDIGTVRVGAPVRLRVWAWPLREFEGQVVAIAPVVELSPSNPFMRVVRVGFDIPNPDGTLKSAMSGFAKISAGEQPLIVAFSRALVRFVRLEAWSWLP
ncbi:MAG TPA: efflux RND transporter periplasmic adaptor subunit, partial [Candidatus Competibacteraceae bacterium]|nr:efflux RND transporter periplasmic adaptor subunit [Candidatus Competibacteraceae bacterium]